MAFIKMFGKSVSMMKNVDMSKIGNSVVTWGLDIRTVIESDDS